MGQELSRRNFISGALLAGMGLAGAGVLTACSGNGGEAKQEGGDNSGITWDKEADVVILGSGAAGMYGCVVAADNGLTPLLLEKQPESTAGGDLRVSGGYLMGNATDITQLTAAAYGTVSEEWIQEINEYADEAIQWVIDHGCEWTDGKEYTSVVGGGPAIYECLRDYLVDEGIEIMYETPGTALITDNDGVVVGVVAGSSDSPINVKAKYGVLIATGSYTMNPDLMTEFHLPGREYYSIGGKYLTGDGLIMAGNKGARLSKLARSLEPDTLVAKAASEEFGIGITASLPRGGAFIYVNQDGNRFMDETFNLMHNKGTLPTMDFTGTMMGCRAGEEGYLNDRMYEIVDQATFEQFSLGNTQLHMTWANVIEEDGYVWSEDNQTELSKGWVLKGDTLADLAKQIDVDPAALQEAVDAYNAACAAGADEFGRSADSLVPFGSGPYYAIELAVSILYSIGGLTTDDNGRTLNWSNEPIPRLYSAGNVGEVGTFLQPTAIGGAWAQAMIAINDISENLEPWDAE